MLHPFAGAYSFYCYAFENVMACRRIFAFLCIWHALCSPLRTFLRHSRKHGTALSGILRLSFVGSCYMLVLSMV